MHNESIWWTDSVNQYQNYFVILSIAAAPFIIPMIFLSCLFAFIARLFTLRKIRRRKTKKREDAQVKIAFSKLIEDTKNLNKDYRTHTAQEAASKDFVSLNNQMIELQKVLQEPKLIEILDKKRSKIMVRHETEFEMSPVSSEKSLDDRLHEIESRWSSFFKRTKIEKAKHKGESAIHNEAYVHDLNENVDYENIKNKDKTDKNVKENNNIDKTEDENENDDVTKNYEVIIMSDDLQ